MSDTRMTSKDWVSIIIAFIGLFGTIIETGNGLTNTITTIVGAILLSGVVSYLFIRQKLNKPNPIQHSFFAKIDIWKSWIKNEYTLPHKVRKMVFQDLLYNVVHIYEKEVYKFVQASKDEKSETLIKNKLLYTLNQIVQKISIYYLENDTNYSNEDKETLSIVVEKFLHYHTIRLNDMRNRCVELILDESYGAIQYRLMAVLILFDSLIVDMLHDSKTTAKEINGTLVGKKFRNEVI